MMKKILFPIDIDDKSSIKAAFPQVIDLVNKLGAELYVISVIQDYGTSMVERYFPKGWIKEVKSDVQIKLDEIVKKYASSIKVNCIVEKGAIYECILDVAKKIEADLIIVKAGRPELKEYLLGPNAAKVVRHADISVLVIRPNE